MSYLCYTMIRCRHITVDRIFENLDGSPSPGVSWLNARSAGLAFRPVACKANWVNRSLLVTRPNLAAQQFFVFFCHRAVKTAG